MNTQLPNWHFVKKRTADPAGGAVYVNDDGTRYRRTGGRALAAEAANQRQLAELGYPVPRVLDDGTTDDGNIFVVEEALGERSLHDMALESLNGTRPLRHGGRSGRRGRGPAAAGPGRAHGPHRPPGAARVGTGGRVDGQRLRREPRPRQSPGAGGPGQGDGPARRRCDGARTSRLRPAQRPAGRRHRLAARSTTAWCRSATTQPWPWRSSRSRAAPRATWRAPSSGAGTWRR